MFIHILDLKEIEPFAYRLSFMPLKGTLTVLAMEILAWGMYTLSAAGRKDIGLWVGDTC